MDMVVMIHISCLDPMYVLAACHYICVVGDTVIRIHVITNHIHHLTNIQLGLPNFFSMQHLWVDTL